VEAPIFSMVERITLSKLVIRSISHYHMHYAKISKNICDKIEKIQCGFLWGDIE